MRSQPKPLILIALSVMLLPAASVTNAAAAAPPPSHSPATAKHAAKQRVIPDYGGRDSTIESTIDQSGAATAVDPMAQAGRAFEALVVVLALVVGGLFLLKKSGVIKSGADTSGTAAQAPWSFLKSLARPANAPPPSSEPTTELLSVIGSQTLPQSGGARLHLVSVGDRLLLIGATSQSVTVLTEVAQIGEFSDNPKSAAFAETQQDEAAFADYLERIGLQPPPAAVGKTVGATLSAATGRLQSLLRPHVEGESPRE